MTGMIWFPFYPNDWLGSKRVKRMTNEQRGAYIMLLIWQWQSPGGELDNDMDALSAYAEVQDIRDKKWQCVLECFPENGNKRRNTKLYDLWNEAKCKRDKAIQSANKMWAEKRSHMPTHSEGICDGICSPPPPPPPPPEAHTQEEDIVEQEFDKLWNAYPSKTGSKEKSLTAWLKWRKLGDTQEIALAGIARYVQYVVKRRVDGFPDLKFQNGQTFFNGRGWTSEWTQASLEKHHQSGTAMASAMIGERKPCPPIQK